MTATERGRGASVILPVRGHSTLLDGCLAAVAAQRTPPGEVILVDDSPDASLPAPPGVRTLRSRGAGPYAARNTGRRGAAGEVLLFLDVRSRPRPEWVEQMVAPFDDAAVAVVGSETAVSAGDSWGARASHRQQFYALRNYLAAPFFRPYLPTCNLAVRRSDLEAVGGFPEVRSGGDAEACWAVLELPGRRLVALEQVLMDWVPRDSAWSYLEQNFRYGRSHHSLRARWASRGAPPLAPQPWPRVARQCVGVCRHLAAAAFRGDAAEVGERLAHAAGPALALGYRTAHDRAQLRRWVEGRGGPARQRTSDGPAGGGGTR